MGAQMLATAACRPNSPAAAARVRARRWHNPVAASTRARRHDCALEGSQPFSRRLPSNSGSHGRPEPGARVPGEAAAQHPSADGAAMDAVAACDGADASMRRVAHLGRLENRPTSRAELRRDDLRTIAPSSSRRQAPTDANATALAAPARRSPRSTTSSLARGAREHDHGQRNALSLLAGCDSEPFVQGILRLACPHE